MLLFILYFISVLVILQLKLISVNCQGIISNCCFSFSRLSFHLIFIFYLIWAFFFKYQQCFLIVLVNSNNTEEISVCSVFPRYQSLRSKDRDFIIYSNVSQQILRADSYYLFVLLYTLILHKNISRLSLFLFLLGDFWETKFIPI